VLTRAERDMFVWKAIQLHPFRIRKYLLITVGRGIRQKYPISLRKLPSVNVNAFLDRAGQAMDRGEVAKELFARERQ